MILSNISVPLLGAVDTAILGHLPTAEYLSGVAIGAAVISMLLWAFGFLRMGTTGLVARNADGGEEWLLRALLLAIALGLLLVPLAWPLLGHAVEWMNASAEAGPHAEAYLKIRLLSAPLALANFALLGFFIGRQDSRAPLYLLLAANLLNIALDVLFIIGMGLGARGAALATVCADIVAFALGIRLLRRIAPGMPGALLEKIRLPGLLPWQDSRPWAELLRINSDLFLRTLLLLFTFAFFTAQGAAQGDDVLAANAILVQLLMMTSYALDGFAHATEALVGNAIFHRSRAQFRATVRSAGGWALGTAVAITVFFSVSEPLLLPLFTDLDSVLAEATRTYAWLCALPLIAVWCYQLDGVFIGAGKSRQMRDTMFIATALVFLPAWWLTQQWGNHGVWFSLFLWFSARSIGLILYFYYYTWKNQWI
ncbi:MATE family efflux transporter [Microbulbifer guangxiensis]|uniref:MATE family efflux transporter n=1 Tax=Microbulbifer guangxiensis TaxID=2904249 RepID=UPI001F301BFF|nr:MATE family efflux transporter [Microbulbifer guangxiensis]